MLVLNEAGFKKVFFFLLSPGNHMQIFYEYVLDFKANLVRTKI